MQRILDEIALYTQHEANRELSDEVMHHAKRAVVDWFSALYPGTRVAPATNLVRAHFRELGHGRSSLPGFKTTAFPATAAWINGTASHAVEFDDIFRDAVYHPGVPTIAAALAVAEDEACSGRDLLRAVTVGYEVSTRIGAAVQPSHYRFFHTTGTVGCFGSAAAVAFLTNPGDTNVMRHALATAATFASGLQQAFRSESMTKALHGGHAAAAGVTAAKGAANGITGALDILEGDAGFGAAMSDGPHWHRATDGLGERYNITQVTQKNHGCCGHTFAAIDAALVLRSEIGELHPAAIRSIAVDTYQAALDVTGNADPQSAQQARFSLPYVISHALLYGSVRLNAFTETRLSDERTRALMRRVSLNADPELSAKFPAVRAARVTITTEDGRTFQHFSPYRKGDPEAPLTDGELNDKFDELVAPVIGAGPALQLRDKLWQLDRIDLADLRLVPEQPAR
ncbi:MmgE/PrpD family protein [Noviherbaspirillum denitrificans]|uniref:2-methylcitrate dehydratase n=1 Tax=Noviherbaspirillum denitrificans TaxID=1968433 RepID=A0A254TG88_9BURK|nr:MmgE/PrpD family protein [Noviherbaspirillum denitrificans]OWW21624.1 2-methylcitrate dehydratase [Noviherbaspirillum denitrificans]